VTAPVNGAEVRVYPTPEALAQAVAYHVVTHAVDAVAQQKRFTLALAGGSTPRPAYELLATPRFAERVDFARVHFFWGDERAVPPDHPRSNYRMADEALLQKVPVPPANVHRVKGELPPEQAAAAYEAELRSVFGEVRVPRFDLILLGLGEDGHTASLFPGSAALREEDRWVVAHHVDAVDDGRITLTPPVINAAANVTFVVSGADKADAVAAILRGPHRPEELPAQLVEPRQGRERWLLDEAAARAL
jgi:6-phosphogluconolactonase